MPTQPVLIAGEWRAASAGGTFHAEKPATGETLPDEFPVSAWADCDAALAAAAAGAAIILRTTSPEQVAKFLTRFAERIEARKSELVEIAHAETALPKVAAPRRRGIAAHDRPIAPGRRRRARRFLGDADD